MRLSSLIVSALLFSVAAHAEDDRQRQAREDLERQLKMMVGTPPTKIRVTFLGLDEPNIKVVEASFELDGASLPSPSLSKLGGEGELPIFVGDIEPGEHVLVSKLVLENMASPVLVAEGGMKWPLQLKVKFNALPGIEVAYQIKPSQNPQASDAKQRFTMTAPHTLRMLAKLDDGSIPEPMKRTVAVAETPVAVAAAGDTQSPKTKAAQAEAEAAAEKKQAAQEAKEAKAQAARDAKEAKEAKRRAAEEAKEAKRRAAKEKALPRLPAVEAPEPAPTTVTPTPKPTPMTLSLMLPVAELVDAGAVAEVVDAGTPPVIKPVLPPVEARPAEEKGLPLPLIVGGAVVLLGVIVLLASRRKKN